MSLILDFAAGAAFVGDAATNLTESVVPPPPPSASDSISPADLDISAMTSREFLLSISMMIFGLLVICGQLFYVRTTNEEEESKIAAESAIRLTIVSMIIVGSLVLISSGYNKDQIGPAMGLFGTLAGYLIGRQDRK